MQQASCLWVRKLEKMAEELHPSEDEIVEFLTKPEGEKMRGIRQTHRWMDVIYY